VLKKGKGRIRFLICKNVAKNRNFFHIYNFSEHIFYNASDEFAITENILNYKLTCMKFITHFYIFNFCMSMGTYYE